MNTLLLFAMVAFAAGGDIAVNMIARYQTAGLLLELESFPMDLTKQEKSQAEELVKTYLSTGFEENQRTRLKPTLPPHKVYAMISYNIDDNKYDVEYASINNGKIVSDQRYANFVYSELLPEEAGSIMLHQDLIAVRSTKMFLEQYKDKIDKSKIKRLGVRFFAEGLLRKGSDPKYRAKNLDTCIYTQYFIPE